MFKPNELEAMPIPIEQQYKELEDRIMSDIVRRIKINSEVTRSADWQMHRLSELGKSKAEIKKYIKEALKLSDKEVDKLYSGAIESGYAHDEALYKAAGKDFIPFSENKGLQQIISSVAAQTKGEFKNITQSMGFAVRGADGKIAFTKLADYYQKTLDGAMFDITSGAFDYNTVLKRVVNEMTNSGLRTIDYASGWSNRVPVAARRAVMTGIGQVSGKINEDNAKALDTEYFEVDWHSGARPSHQEWQGKVYSKEQLTTVCGLGSGGGLCGWNCYHDYYPFIPGISERSYTDEWLEEQNKGENTPVAYSDKEYTKYEALQKQRKLETVMRKQRQDIKLLKDGGADEDDIIAARCRYRGTSAEYVRFSKEMKLPQQRERVYMDGLGNIGQGKYKLSGNSNVIAEKSTNNYTRITKEAIESIPKVTISGYTDKECTIIQQKHKELLKMALDVDDSKEVAFILSNDFAEQSIDFGENDILEFKSKKAITMLSSYKDLFVMHNHPKNSSFSLNDITEIIKNDRIKSMSIVKNNGTVEILTKSNAYDKIKAKRCYSRSLKQYVKQGTAKEYTDTIKSFIDKVMKEGIFEWTM